jgi:hypothetical protein
VIFLGNGRFIIATLFFVGMVLAIHFALNLIWPSLFWPSAAASAASAVFL